MSKLSSASLRSVSPSSNPPATPSVTQNSTASKSDCVSCGCQVRQVKDTKRQEDTVFSKEKDKRMTKFTWTLNPDPKTKMEIAGTFNSWQRVPMTYERATGNWVFNIELPLGHYQYKYIVNDEWKVDPSKPTEYDNVGNLNNKLDVK
jgi:hypothetical protein